MESVLEQGRWSELVLRSTRVGFARVSAEGKFVACNDAYATALGYTPISLLRTKFQNITHPADTDDDITLAQQVMDPDNPRTSYVMWKRYITADGRIQPGRITVVGVFSATVFQEFLVMFEPGDSRDKLQTMSVPVSPSLEAGSVEKTIHRIKTYWWIVGTAIASAIFGGWQAWQALTKSGQ